MGTFLICSKKGQGSRRNPEPCPFLLQIRNVPISAILRAMPTNMARNAAITGWGKCLPPAVLSNADIATFLDTSDEWITSRTGITESPVTSRSQKDTVDATIGEAVLTPAVAAPRR